MYIDLIGYAVVKGGDGKYHSTDPKAHFPLKPKNYRKPNGTYDFGVPDGCLPSDICDACATAIITACGFNSSCQEGAKKYTTHCYGVGSCSEQEKNRAVIENPFKDIYKK